MNKKGPPKPKKDSKPAPYNAPPPLKPDKKFSKLSKPLKKQPNDDAYFYKKKADDDQHELYRQDLVNTGVSVWEAAVENPEVNRLIEQFPECFEAVRRPVMLNTDDSGHLFLNSKSRILRREDLGSEYDLLADNEEIPDWFDAN